ncbi:MAG TPA: hypothetical protein VMJ32_05780 [Pirellulales bacterium]|nr:hypothetical protein [Pirellulales bacterium]
MFLTLLVVTFLVASAVSTIVIVLFRKPARLILQRIIADTISTVWLRYLMFALFVVGISSGVRIRDLEKYITKPAGEHTEITPLTAERWVLEVYRTIVETLQGLAWALLVFFICTLFAYMIVRVFELKRPKAEAS